MMRKNLFLLILFSVLCSLFSVKCYAQEQITITTYYPSPYGSYKELRADQMAIGSTYRSSALADGNLLVSGNVGIGTTVPAAKLDVNGMIRTTGTASVPTSGSGLEMYYYTDGASYINSYNRTSSSFLPLYLYGSSIRLMNGNVGIGTASPTVPLQINGPATGAVRIVDGNQAAGKVLTSDASGVATWQGGVPTGAVMFFNLAACPSGWTLFGAANGRYIVGASAGIGTAVGTALSSGENRPVGQHRHEIAFNRGNSYGFKEGSDDPFPVNYTPGWAWYGWTMYEGDVGSNQMVWGTNAPYIQLLACQKN